MNNDEVLAQFGISKRLAHGLMIQSILVKSKSFLILYTTDEILP